MKKILFKLLSFSLIFLFVPFIVHADDSLDEYLSSMDISNILEVYTNLYETPTINARHAIVFDRNSRYPIFTKKENEKCKMASTTKIMTAIIVLENADLNDIVIISSNAANTGGSRIRISKNDKVSVNDLLYGLMLKSGNNAAVALAEHVGGNLENFAVLMNKKARELNLKNTNFVTPHGLDNDNHYTTALDLALLTDYALQNEKFCKIVKTKSYTIMVNNIPISLNNTNELLGNYDGIYGVKTGFTNGANRCLVTSCKRGNLDVICVVLGCDTKKDRTRDSVKLLNYTFNNFSVINIKSIILESFNKWKKAHKNAFIVNKGISNNLELYLNSEDFKFSHIAVNKSDINSIFTYIIFDTYFDAPLNYNTKIGEIKLTINGREYLSVSILNNNCIEKKNYFDYMVFIFRNYIRFFKSTTTI